MATPLMAVISTGRRNTGLSAGTGIAAFPDGGVPRYEQDGAVIATVDVAGGKPRILQRLENRGVHGSPAPAAPRISALTVLMQQPPRS